MRGGIYYIYIFVFIYIFFSPRAEGCGNRLASCHVYNTINIIAIVGVRGRNLLYLTKSNSYRHASFLLNYLRHLYFLIHFAECNANNTHFYSSTYTLVNLSNNSDNHYNFQKTTYYQREDIPPLHHGKKMCRPRISNFPSLQRTERTV